MSSFEIGCERLKGLVVRLLSSFPWLLLMYVVGVWLLGFKLFGNIMLLLCFHVVVRYWIVMEGVIIIMRIALKKVRNIITMVFVTIRAQICFVTGMSSARKCTVATIMYRVMAVIMFRVILWSGRLLFIWRGKERSIVCRSRVLSMVGASWSGLIWLRMA